MTAVAAPPVIAPAGTVPCRDPWPDAKGIYCERPKGHAGGHRSESRDRYWQARERRS